MYCESLYAHVYKYVLRSLERYYSTDSKDYLWGWGCELKRPLEFAIRKSLMTFEDQVSQELWDQKQNWRNEWMERGGKGRWADKKSRHSPRKSGTEIHSGHKAQIGRAWWCRCAQQTSWCCPDRKGLWNWTAVRIPDDFGENSKLRGWLCVGLLLVVWGGREVLDWPCLVQEN